MAKNRTETKSEINLVFQPVLEIADHRTYLNEQADDVVFRKDVIQTQIAVSTIEIIDFAGKDTYVYTTTGVGNVGLTLNNLDNGDVKHLIINKNASQTINFVNAENLTEYPARLLNLTLLLYRISNKNGNIYAELLSNTVGSIPWIATTIFGESSFYSKYRLDEFGYLEINVSFLNGTLRDISTPLFVLPSGFIPSWTPKIPAIVLVAANNNMYGAFVSIESGSVYLKPYSISGALSVPFVNIPAGLTIDFYVRIPLTI